MNKLNNKKGISLIVLVITIVVMIILAAAIILSLQSSGIIGRANEAKTKSDTVNAKQVVAMAKAEWELMDITTRGEFSTYAYQKLSEAGFDTSNLYVEEDGNLVIGVSAGFAKNNVPVGAIVEGYVLDSSESAQKYTTSGKENTCASDSTETTVQPVDIQRNDANNNIIWTYFGMDEAGNVLIAANITANSPKMKIGGKGGFVNGMQELKDACKALYSSSMGEATSITMEDVTRVLEYTGPKGYFCKYACMYHDHSAVDDTQLLTMSGVADLLGHDLNGYTSPEPGKNVGDYESNAYSIAKTSSDINSQKVSLIFPDDTSYWLASNSASADIVIMLMSFNMRYVSKTYVSNQNVFYADAGGSSDRSDSVEYAIRPIVKLSDNVNVTNVKTQDGVTTVTISE